MGEGTRAGLRPFWRCVDAGPAVPTLHRSCPENPLFKGRHVIGRNDVDRVALRRDTVQDLLHRHGGPTGDEFGKVARLTGEQMLNDDQRQIRLAGSARKKLCNAVMPPADAQIAAIAHCGCCFCTSMNDNSGANGPALRSRTATA